jgi:YD repeat-containing protein
LSRIEYPSSAFVDYAYTLDRVTAMTVTFDGIAHTMAGSIALTVLIHATIPSSTQTYGYDDLDRLETVTSGLGNQHFAYDASGNRLSHTHSGIASSYSLAPASNHISAISGGLSRSYAYMPIGHPRSHYRAMTATFDGRGRQGRLQAVVRHDRIRPAPSTRAHPLSFRVGWNRCRTRTCGYW